ncbi:RraA family protein [Pseudarthrobacter sp. NPDC057230]|uniref:RraA family protein n=1 Tax=Pseudarthrobacter sp. NPDC057230 TaxID=3346057 RepID=UPI0036308F3B
MDDLEVNQRFATLSTAHVADACIRAGVPVRCGPVGLTPVGPAMRAAGRVLPVVHFGSVDIFLEAIGQATPGNVLTVNNGGRTDEACIGDLIALEAQASQLAGIVIWGLHRDTAEIITIDLPVFSLGATPTGPQQLRDRTPEALQSARVGDCTVDRTDFVFADADGVIFVNEERVGNILGLAETIRDTEGRQAQKIRAGQMLRTQLQFDSYIARRLKEPSWSLREHLRETGAAIE